MLLCSSCSKPLSRGGSKHCSNKCQADFAYSTYIAAWKAGQLDGNRGIKAKNLSGHLRRYLLTKFGEACTQCGWDERNIATGRVPLEIDHIDGNSENNHEANLRLLCPNCHALTPGFRNLNKGNGRKWRRDKYIRNHATLAQR